MRRVCVFKPNPRWWIAVVVGYLVWPSWLVAQDQPSQESQRVVRIATFDVDATPSVGFQMAYDPVRRTAALGLRCRGVVILSEGEPIVLCAVDWIGIGNGGHDAFRETLARAAATRPERVAVHTLHQHDAPRCDFTAEQLLRQAGVTQVGAHEGALARDVLKRLSVAVPQAMERAVPISHVGFGTANVEKVASNRRILDAQGQVRATRYTTCTDPALRAEPEGVIDPQLSSLSFWADDRAIAVLTYYACHPQSYYRTGIPSPDFPGIARFFRSQDQPESLHLHFNGAGGNIGAGKYNDGAKQNRLILARRLAVGMQQAFESSTRVPVTGADIGWSTVPVALPPAPHLERESLRAGLKTWKPGEYWGSPDKLAWLLRCQEGRTIDLSCLKIGTIRILHMPGELFVEYQLAAKAMQPDLKVAMAAYGDYGPGYIGTRQAYTQGGYETSQAASNVAPDVEQVLMEGIRQLLQGDH